MEISIHRALAELKLLDKRIIKSISDAPSFCVPIKNGDKTIGNDSLENYKKKIKGSFDSTLALIERREQIKAKIMYSNAVTKVKVAGEEMTVAEAIEKKNNLKYKKQLLDRLKRDYYHASNRIEDENSELLDRLESFLKATLGDNPSKKEIESVSELFIEKNELKLYDPLDIEKEITALEEEIDGFLMEVDFVLSESNSKTTIEID